MLYQWELFHYSKNDWLKRMFLTGNSQWYNTDSTFKALSIKKKKIIPMYKNSYTEDVNQQPSNLLALESLVV